MLDFIFVGSTCGHQKRGWELLVLVFYYLAGPESRNESTKMTFYQSAETTLPIIIGDFGALISGFRRSRFGARNLDPVKYLNEINSFGFHPSFDPTELKYPAEKPPVKAP